MLTLLKNLWRKNGAAHRKDSSRNNRFRPQVEVMEERNLMSGSSFQAAGAQWPNIGADNQHMPSVIITIGPGGTITRTDTHQGPFDGIEDTYVGVVNQANSGRVLHSLTLSGSNIFGFEGDGIQSFSVPSSYAVPPSAGHYSVSGYEGPGTYFKPTNSSAGAVIFDGGGGLTDGLRPGQQTFFSLEEAPTSILQGTVSANLTAVVPFLPRPGNDGVANPWTQSGNKISGQVSVINSTGTDFVGDVTLQFSSGLAFRQGFGPPVQAFTQGSYIQPYAGNSQFGSATINPPTANNPHASITFHNVSIPKLSSVSVFVTFSSRFGAMDLTKTLFSNRGQFTIQVF